MRDFLDYINRNNTVPQGGVSRDTFGRLKGLVSSAGITLPLSNLRTATPVKLAFYGDSISNISSYPNFDVSKVASGTIGFTGERGAPHVNAVSNGLIQVTANCGVSGETTTQMVTREGAGSSATRKNIADAASTGAVYIVNSFGVNDIISGINSATSAAQIATVINTALTNVQYLLKRQRLAGMWSITLSLLGYSPTSTVSAGDILARQLAIKTYNTKLSGVINGANGNLGSYVDVNSKVADSAGAWLSGMTQGDGVHPSYNGFRTISYSLVSEILRVEGLGGLPIQIFKPKDNVLANADFSVPGIGSTMATGFTIYQFAATSTFDRVVIDWRGKTWQEVVVTPVSMAGGYTGIVLDFAIPTTLAQNDVISGEYDIYIDNGNYQPATNVYQYQVRLRQNTVYMDAPAYNAVIDPKIGLNYVVDDHVSIGPITVPATPITTSIFSLFVIVNALGVFRVRVSSPVVVKVT